MKATVDAGAFFKALNRVIPLLKVSAIPALSEASIQFHDGVCTITATDLELLKYIWQRNKSILTDLVRDYCCGEIDTEDIFELSVMLLVEYICVDYLPEDDPNDFYGEEYTCYLLMETELDDYLMLIAQIETLRFRTTECTGRNKLRDAVEMFMGNVLYDFKIVPCEAGCVIYLWPPPDYYDPIEFANSIIDLMAYIGAEIDRMKAELAALTAAEQEMEVAA